MTWITILQNMYCMYDSLSGISDDADGLLGHESIIQFAQLQHRSTVTFVLAFLSRVNSRAFLFRAYSPEHSFFKYTHPHFSFLVYSPSHFSVVFIYFIFFFFVLLFYFHSFFTITFSAISDYRNINTL